ncbi:class I SAM-dependent methyltransferase [Aminobacter anthyllidis]|uniref:class I SAM-dependent methyltransferase n=1 Tax=Aminobacter anthyllidis TaxID=1035067 RepID=UPI001FE913F9|nr:class I SAM-dependent methyltransferase [Aminobacter anthyllidis]
MINVPHWSKPARRRIKHCHALDGDAGRLAHFYRGWASSYDLYVGREGYCGSTVVAQLADAVQAAYLANGRAAIAILDPGCGTGLVGVQLKRLGFHLLDWFDLSEEEMAGKALKTRVYSHVRSDVDLDEPLSDYSSTTYDITGLLRRLHARARPIGRMRELARVTRPNGFIRASTRKSCTVAKSFEDEVRSLQDEGVLVTARCLYDGRFIAGGGTRVFQAPDRDSAPAG